MKSLSDYAAQCIRCGFCLEACPTYVLSGEETESPRGRIYLARSAESGKLAWETIRPHMDHCLGCRACETACPSGVEYGAILELARAKLNQIDPSQSPQKLLQNMTDTSRLSQSLKLGQLVPMKTIPKWVAGIAIGAKGSVAKPSPPPKIAWPQLTPADLPEVRGQVTLLEGCAMRVLYPHVHEATRRLLRRAGFEAVANDAGCCGALHAHSGELESGIAMAQSALGAMPPNVPVVVNSAGCGSHLKDLASRGELGAPNPIFDVAEYLAQADLGFLARSPNQSEPIRITYHDACHLAHGQKITAQPREILAQLPGVELVEMADSTHCCGSAGTYSFLQPQFANPLRDKKWATIDATNTHAVVMGNPGCQAWIEAGRNQRAVMTLHWVFFVEAMLSGLLRVEDDLLKLR